jgi:hypothetical protein
VDVVLATFRRKKADFGLPISGEIGVVGLYSSANPSRGEVRLDGCALSPINQYCGKEGLTNELCVARLMVNGSLSELTRQRSFLCLCGPVARHGPHLYPKFSAEGKAYSVYIPAEQQEAAVSASGMVRFNEVASEMASRNRQRLLQALDSHKQVAKAARAKARAKA